MIAYKFFGSGARGLFSDRPWPLGEWVEAAPGPLDPCRNGVHACEVHDLPYWIADELWEVELDGERVPGPQSLVARRGRLVRKVDAWTSANASDFAQRCRARAEAFVAQLPDTELRDRGAQYLATANSSYDAGNYAVTAYASAMAFTLAGASALAAFRAEREEQSKLLSQLLGL